MTEGRIEAIHIAPEAEAPTKPVESVEAVAGKGLRGDRYFDEQGTFSDMEGSGRHLTLIEAEAIEAVERETGIDIAPGEHRRNVTTRDVAVNHLVGERFTVGDAVCEGARLCEPCNHLQSLTGEDELIQALLHRGGLRADVVETGRFEIGDPVAGL